MHAEPETQPELEEPVEVAYFRNRNSKILMPLKENVQTSLRFPPFLQNLLLEIA